ncbi:hypothetical protein DFH08DRAFT_973836 [Mycena albidolilacea]|uniref:Uncharacterized protein n=1 Tax=Mycena albidolilacea TaxID=1033008 RepID=A0AAD6Z8Z5_9AGAR|nr:hypothetical protein DFH08DRAFT_973836 [Mycena albidolilacea]
MSICGIFLPLIPDFDFVSHKKRLPEFPSTPAEDMDLQDKNSENLRIELHNKSSGTFTRACEAAAASAAAIGLLDVGASLQGFIAYSDKEKALFYLGRCYPFGASSASSNAHVFLALELAIVLQSAATPISPTTSPSTVNHEFWSWSCITRASIEPPKLTRRPQRFFI